MRTKKYIVEYKVLGSNNSVVKESWVTDAYDATDAVTQLEVHVGDKLESVIIVKPYVTLEDQKRTTENLLVEKNGTVRT